MQNRILAYSNHFLVLALFILLLSPVNSYELFGKPQFKNELDSLQSLVQQCPTDSGKFAILTNYFWQNSGSDIKQIKTIGNWAFDIIKNSKNQKACADGYDIKGCLFEKEEKLDSAFNCFDTALKLSKKAGYKSRMAWSYYHLGLLNDALGHHEDAISQMRLSIRTFEEINEIYNAYNGIAYVIIMFMRSCQYDSADAYISKRLDIDRKMKDKTSEIFTYNNYSWYYKKIGQSKKSIDYMNCALRLAENNNDVLLSDVYVIIGEFFLGQKKNKQLALEYCKKGFEADSSSTYVYQLFAKYYLEESKDSQALKYAQQGIRKSKNEQDLHEANQTLALVYQRFGKARLALDAIMKCYEHARSFYPEFEFYEILLQIGDLNLKLGNYIDALKYYHETLELAERYHAKRAFVLANLKIGKCYFEQKHEDKSESFYLSALKTAQEIKDVYLLKSTTEALRNFYFKRNNLLTAYSYSILSQTMSDSIAQLDNEASLTELEMNFELSKIRQDNETRQTISLNEIKRQKTFRNAFILISGLLILLGFIVFSSYRRKRKDNKLLTIQKNEIEEKNFEIQSQIEEILTQKDEIERISQTLHEADQAKLRFFSNISHEIRTPLTLIISPLKNFMTSFSGNNEQKKQLELIHSNATRLQELTNQILDLQKLDSGKLTLSFEKDDIIAHTKGIISVFEGFCNKTNCSLLFNSEYSSVFCEFDKDKITKIISNLLSNAFKYSEAGGCIKLSITVDAQKLKLNVIDNGLGIPSEQINKVFDRYYQLEHSNTRFEGTGIGLAFVKELVELMKGSITIQSEENTGTTVDVVIPIVNIDIVDFSACEVHIKPGKQFLVNNSSIELTNIDNDNTHVVLIVEDNDDLRNFIGAIFKDNFQILFAKNGKEGIEKATRYLPDAIISDVMMPVIDGIEMCSHLKKNEQTSHIPIIMLTAKDSYESQLDGYQSGVDDYIVKPFDSDLMKLKLLNILETREAARKKFSFGFDSEELKLLEIDNQFIQKCIRFIRDNIDNPNYSTEQLASEMAFSQRNFYRKIKALTNQTPSDFIRIYKLQHAANLIKSNTMRIYEVASAIGFESSERFSQSFKKHFGVLPSEYKS